MGKACLFLHHTHLRPPCNQSVTLFPRNYCDPSWGPFSTTAATQHSFLPTPAIIFKSRLNRARVGGRIAEDRFECDEGRQGIHHYDYARELQACSRSILSESRSLNHVQTFIWTSFTSSKIWLFIVWIFFKIFVHCASLDLPNIGFF